MKANLAKRLRQAAILCAALATGDPARAALTFTVEANGWPNAAHRDAAVNALQSAVNRYNAYGDFGNYNVYAYYNAGIPTAQASYLGSIGYGGTYPNERVTMHELSHYLGTGTYGTPWDGFRGESLIDQFDGLDASLNGDGAHYWPYGLNFDSEGSEIAKQRHVALLYAMRADMGIGSTAIPGATSATLTGSDPVGESSFNHMSRWSDARFAHAGAAYATGNFAIRTPTGASSWTFAGSSLTVNNTTAAGGFRYNGSSTAGVITVKHLIVNGGTVRHDQTSQDLFQLDGKVTLTENATFDAGQGNMRLLADVGGSGSLVKAGSHTLSLAGGATYAGNTTINAGVLRIEPVAPVARYTFDSVSGNTVGNTGNGGSAMNGTLTGGATIVGGGRFGNAVSLSGGASVDINNPILDLRHDGNWTVSAWVKTTTPGGTLLTKGAGAGWGNGNTIFYLGDGTAGGSGGLPSSVRWGGGFNQASTAGTPVTDNAWRQVTYVNSGGNYAIYVDGVLQPMSPGNSGFTNFDIGSMVRLGASTNTVAGDGAVNFSGLLDTVQFYKQALSGQQIAALYEGSAVVGMLPATTHLSIAAGASLELSNSTQTVASLSGPAGSGVSLGAGRLRINTTTDTQFSGNFTGSTGAVVKTGPGTLTLAGTSTANGTTQIDGGVLRVNGTHSGPVAINSGGTLQGAGSIGGLVLGGLGATLAPGASAGVLTAGSLELAAGAQTQIELGGTTRGAQHDALVVNGAALLNGALAVSLIDGFQPAAGNAFDIFDWSNPIGAFANVSLPLLSGGLAWDATNLYTTGVLSVVNGTPLPGDFNDDQAVDALDLEVWRGAVGTTAQGDADGDGDSDGADFVIWQRGLGGAMAPTAAVPEPAGAWGISLALLAPWIGRRRGIAIAPRSC
ncbi:MAG TPA: LamG-like jellyroll fold domain-containing protein [Lacipirellulaceae bacterium]|nr:LamG-like jellyroll fold domain-containing protein [Lacipirellulaceae bacterium]